MADDDQAMRALMGFSSFGRPRKRVRRNEAESAAAPSRQRDVHHVVPATVVEEDESLSSSCRRLSVTGIALLLHPAAQQQRQDERATSENNAAHEPQEEESVQATWTLPPSAMELLARVESTKARLGLLKPAAFARARRQANPFEPLGRHRFLNRSAMKMANLDFLFQWSERPEPLVFADVCGGPGGFSEYFLWRRQRQERKAVGFGITLKGAPWCDWKVGGTEDETVEFHICDGVDGTGDLYKIPNIHCFRDTVRKAYPEGVHLVVADGGFPDARDQSNQELLMTRLILAETLTMFSVLGAGGSFVCKTFELSTPLMLQLFWLLNNCFDEITIVKPVTSRPASSERYIVAQSLCADLPKDAIQRELARLVDSLAPDDPLQASIELPEAFSTSRGLDACLAFVAQASDRLATQQIATCEAIIAVATESSSPTHGLRIHRDNYYRAWKL